MITSATATGSDEARDQVPAADGRREGMTVSTEHIAVPSSREPASGPFPAVTPGVPGAVAALKRAMADGTVHHHGTAPTAAVVRVWAGGGDPAAQQEACADCIG
ncbi:hypothetical protein WCD74_02400 [Actinomycetospora sp. OC33-EN08]|uniref:Uncharacterized protein n=1 Tax=Actinomycetospora aurantiaca TaxID=3129233 RepID=A0ABU8MH36_9PSEU